MSADCSLRYVINFPTKRHWKGKSRMADIDAGLDALIEDVRRLGVKSIAIPPLGCGNGGLDWAAVEPRIRGPLRACPTCTSCSSAHDLIEEFEAP